MRYWVIILVAIFTACNTKQSSTLEEIAVRRLDFANPVGIFYSEIDTAFYFTTTDGELFKTDTSFQVINQKDFKERNITNLYIDEYFVYILSDAFLLKIDKRNFEIAERKNLSGYGVNSKEIVTFFFNSYSKTFDFLVKKRRFYLYKFNPYNFSKQKRIVLPKINNYDVGFAHKNNLYLLNNSAKLISVYELENLSVVVKTYKYTTGEIASGSFIPPDKIVLVSKETRRAFVYQIRNPM